MRSGSGQRPHSGRYNSNQPQQQRTPQRNQTFDSNGPNLRVRGSAHQIFERYIALAREAAIGGDRIAAENFYQHADHYFRLTGANHEGARQGIAPQQTTPTDDATDGPEPEPDESNGERSQPGWNDDRPGFT
jgi:Domain of unknown function (DUF4167)